MQNSMSPSIPLYQQSEPKDQHDSPEDVFKRHLFPGRYVALEYYLSCSIPADADLNWAHLDEETLLDLTEAMTDNSGSDLSQLNTVAYLRVLLFSETKDPQHLHEALRMKRAAIAIVMATHNAALAEELECDIISLLACQYNARGNVKNLAWAAAFADRLFRSTPVTHPDRERRSADLVKLQSALKMAKNLRLRYVLDALHKTELLSVGEEQDQLVTAKPTGGLGNQGKRSVLSPEAMQNNLSKRIQYLTKALENAPEEKRAQLADELSSAAIVKWGACQTREDMDMLIEYLDICRQSVRGIATLRCVHLGVLGITLCAMYKRDQRISNLERARDVFEEAIKVQDMPEFSYKTASTILAGGLIADALLGDQRLQYVGRLGGVLTLLYDLTKEAGALQRGVELLEQHWLEAPEKDEEALESGEVLLVSYGKLYSVAQDLEHVDKAVDLANEILSHADSSYIQQHRVRILGHQANSLMVKYQRTSRTDFLQRAIKQREHITSEIEFDRDDGPEHLANLANLYRTRFHHFGDPLDIENFRRAANETLDRAEVLESPSQKAMAMNRLGIFYNLKYSATKSSAYLKEALRYHTQAAKLIDDKDRNFPEHIMSLADCLFDYYVRMNNRTCLDYAVDLSVRAIVADQSSDIIIKTELHMQWSKFWLVRFCTDPKRYASELHDFLNLASAAFNVVPLDDRSWERAAMEFAGILLKVFDKTKDGYALDHAIRIARQATNTELDLPYAVERKRLLAVMLVTRFNHQSRNSVQSDVDEALNLLLGCIDASDLDPLAQIRVAMMLSSPIFREEGSLGWRDLARSTSRVVHLLPKVIARGLQSQDQKHLLRRMIGVATTAAAATLAASPTSAQEALELLEYGRGILTTYMLDARSDWTEFRRINEGLAAQLEHKMMELNREAHLASKASAPWAPVVFSIDRAHTLNNEIDAILSKFQALAHKDTALAPVKLNNMRGLVDGTIFVINVTFFRCDALIIDQEGMVRHEPLPRLSLHDIEGAIFCMKQVREPSPSAQVSHLQRICLRTVLKWLWNAIVGPLIDAAGFREPPVGDKWPRVWWIPTGPLIQLPLHAAGIHEPGSTDAALDRVVSSYSSSVKALMYTRNNRKPQGGTREAPRYRVVLACMRTTPGLRPLYHAKGEIKMIKSILGSRASFIELKPPRKQTLLAELELCDVFHFAGHGEPSIDDPYLSKLYLDDWRTDPLTVRDLANLKLHKRSPWLAYLSACSTGENKDERLPDEAISLVAACQLAGFQNVLGSFWEVSDAGSRIVAADVYRTVRDSFGITHDIALALHHAVRRLRRLQPVTATQGCTSRASKEDTKENDQEEYEQEQEEDPEVKLFWRFIEDASFTAAGPLSDLRHVGKRRRLASEQKTWNMGDPFVWASYFHVGL
jgi:CHAT domain-containing protein/tetratricopeptide (TPR) repeat protein